MRLLISSVRLRSCSAVPGWISVGSALMEVMITVALMGILLQLAVPSFMGLVDANRTNSEINMLVHDIYYARAMAVRNRMPVTICASVDGATCTSGAAGWQVGWIVFLDPRSQHTASTADELLRVQQSFAGSDTLLSHNMFNSKPIGAITYARTGLASNLSATALYELSTIPADAANRRCVVVRASGQQRLQPCT